MKVHTEEDISFFPGVKIDRKFGGWTVPWHCVSSLISDSKKRGYSFECDGWIGGEKPKKKGDKASILKTVKNNSLLKSNFRLYGYQNDEPIQVVGKPETGEILVDHDIKKNRGH
jgi:hypothetical protein